MRHQLKIRLLSSFFVSFIFSLSAFLLLKQWLKSPETLDTFQRVEELLADSIKEDEVPITLGKFSFKGRSHLPGPLELFEDVDSFWSRYGKYSISLTQIERSFMNCQTARENRLPSSFYVDVEKKIHWYLGLKCLGKNESVNWNDVVKWLAQKPFVSPYKKSFSLLIIEKFKDKIPSKYFLKMIPYLHSTELNLVLKNKDVSSLSSSIQNRVQFSKVFRHFSWVGRDRYFRDYQFFVDNGIVQIAIRKGLAKEVTFFEESLFRKALQSRNLSMKNKFEADRCELVLSNYCFFELATVKPGSFHATDFVNISISFFIFALTFLSFWLLLERNQIRIDARRLEKEQAFIFKVLTHELRTPMARSQLTLGDMRDSFDLLPEVAQRGWMQLNSNVSEMNYHLLHGMKQLSKAAGVSTEDDPVVSVNIVNVVDRLVERKYDGLLELKLPEDSIVVDLDPYLLELCLINLIGNAFSHGKSPVTVEVGKNAKGKPFISVMDCGKLDEAVLQKVSVAFVKGKHSKGLGLGLFIVSQKVKEWGATLEIRANPTSFKIIF